MQSFHRLILALSIFSVIPCCLAQTGQSSSPWQAIALADLEKIYQTAKENHPGVVDDENPWFREWFETGYLRSKEMAAEARNLQDATNAIKYYVAGFADGHFSVSFNVQSRSVVWAGMMVAKRGNRYIVTHAEESWPSPLVPVGAELLTCDNRSPSQVINEDILPFRFNNKELNSVKIKTAPYLMVDDGVGNRVRPTQCRFRSGSGEEETVLMNWRSASRNYVSPLISAATFGEKPGFSHEEFQPGRYWVSLPSFNSNRAPAGKLREMVSLTRGLRSAELVVFDVRGNGGGSSQWGNEILAELYGKEYMEAVGQVYPDNGYALWRASKGNRDFLASQLPKLQSAFGEEPEIVVEITQLVTNLSAALSDGEDLVRQSVVDDDNKRAGDSPSASGISNIVLENEASATSAQVVFLSSSNCASACLDFADALLVIPGVIHLGQDTSADTIYMDVRSAQLPSGLGRISMAQKVYRERRRGHNEFYKPQIYYDGDISDTNSLQSWVVERVDRLTKKEK